VGLELLSALELPVLVRLEVAESDHDRPRVDLPCDLRYACGEPVHELLLVVRFDQAEGVLAYYVRDYELYPHEPYPVEREVAVPLDHVRLPEVHVYLGPGGRVHPGQVRDDRSDGRHLLFRAYDVAIVDHAVCRVHCDQLAVLQDRRSIPRANYAGYAQLPADDRGVARPAAAVGDYGLSLAHCRCPVWRGHVGDEYLAGLELGYGGDVEDDVRIARHQTRRGWNAP